jgi:acetoin utilization protein AcuC
MDRPPAAPAAAYLYSDVFRKFDYGPTHPLRIERLHLADQLIKDCGLGQPSHPFQAATFEELTTFHDGRYLDMLRSLRMDCFDPACGVFGLGAGDNPIFDGVWEWSCLLAGASLAASRLVSQEGHAMAFAMPGGMHHAMAARASGFCYVNDICLVINELLKQNYRVAYIDIDAHHGDGVQWAYFANPNVLTISMHQHPATLFPGTGYVEEMGRGNARGYAVNLPLWPDTDDDIFMECFDRIIPPLIEAYKPDYIVTQLGTDAMMDDPLANLNLTTRGFGHCIRGLRDLCWGRWIALGGGGYMPLDVARAWTLTWAIMLDREDQVPEMLPYEFLERLDPIPQQKYLLDPPGTIRGRQWSRAQRDAKDMIKIIQDKVFPIVGAKRPG